MYMYIYNHVDIFILCIYTYTLVQKYVSISSNLYYHTFIHVLYVHTSIPIYTLTYIHTCRCISVSHVFLYFHICICICMYIHILYIHDIHKYLYIYRWVATCRFVFLSSIPKLSRKISSAKQECFSPGAARLCMISQKSACYQI